MHLVANVRQVPLLAGPLPCPFAQSDTKPCGCCARARCALAGVEISNSGLLVAIANTATESPRQRGTIAQPLAAPVGQLR